jgi:hypothetical protein
VTTKKQVDDARRSAKHAYDEAQAAAEKAQGRGTPACADSGTGTA